MRIFADECVQQFGEFGVAVEAVEGDGGHADFGRGTGIGGEAGSLPEAPYAGPGRGAAPRNPATNRINIRYTVRALVPQPPAMLPAYAELHCLSNFSFLRGASHPEELVERAHALGYAALALTDECSVAGVVRAHLAARDAGLKFVIGSEFTLADGLKLVLYATDRATYGDLAQLITRGRRNATKGSYALTRDDVVALAPRCLALWIPPAAHRELPTADARWFADAFPGRAWIAVELLARSGDRARLAHLEALARNTGLPLVAAGDVHMHARARRALQDTLTAIRVRTPLAECGYALFGNGERHLRSRARLATLYPRELTDATLDLALRCTFSLDELRYEYPEELVPAGATPASHLRELVEAGLRRRFGKAHPQTQATHEKSTRPCFARLTSAP